MKPSLTSGVFLLAGIGLFVAVRPTVAADKDAAWGTIKGRVVLADGVPIPTPEKIDVTKDQQHCLAHGPLYKEDWVVNKENRGVRWAFVWLQAEPGSQPLAMNPALKEIKDKQVTLDQPNCQFEPHALGIREGQEILAKNSAPVPHNVHWTGFPTKNPGDNTIVPPGQAVVIKGLKADRFPVKITCDIHPWMSAWVRIFTNPYFAVTDANGAFEIKDAPAGSFRLIVWQESTGWGPGGAQGTPVTIQGGKVTDQGKIALKPR